MYTCSIVATVHVYIHVHVPYACHYRIITMIIIHYGHAKIHVHVVRIVATVHVHVHVYDPFKIHRIQ